MVKIDFVKMTGAGNDFVLIDDRSMVYQMDWANATPTICDRRYGIGADGLLVIESNKNAIFTMKYYNADGSYGGMCGNGGRCAALYVMEQLSLPEVNFQAIDYVYYAKRTSQGRLQLQMKDPKDIRTGMVLSVFDEEVKLHYVDTGSPHTVIFIDELSVILHESINKNGINEMGKLIRFSSLFAPNGTNVNFISLLGNQSISMRTYERGVEDETLACGTGSVASAIISSLVRGLTSPIAVNTKSNEVLQVSFDKEGERITNVNLEGPAKIVFHGQFVL